MSRRGTLSDPDFDAKRWRVIYTWAVAWGGGVIVENGRPTAVLPPEGAGAWPGEVPIRLLLRLLPGEVIEDEIAAVATSRPLDSWAVTEFYHRCLERIVRRERGEK